MADIARECGVTKMTVSRVLAGGNGVKPATREKVLAAAMRLNYEVNILAQNFKTNRSGFIGVATAFTGLLHSNYFSEILQGYNRVFMDTSWDLALFNTVSESFNNGAKLAKLYRQRRVDGLLITSPHTDDRFVETLEQLHMPMVLVGEMSTGPSVCSVSCDDHEGIESICKYLFLLGHRKIAFVEGPPNTMTGIRRKEAYTGFCSRKGLQNPPHFIQPGDYTMRTGRDAGLALLRSADRPTAIVAASDMMAYGVIESARELNLRVPEDVSVSGFDDLPSAAERHPALTTVHQPVREMGERSARALLSSLDSGATPVGQTVMSVSLVVRQSTGAPPETRGA